MKNALARCKGVYSSLLGYSLGISYLILFELYSSAVCHDLGSLLSDGG